MTVAGMIGSSLLEGNLYGGRVGLVARLITGEQHVRIFSYLLLDVD